MIVIVSFFKCWTIKKLCAAFNVRNVPFFDYGKSFALCFLFRIVVLFLSFFYYTIIKKT